MGQEHASLKFEPELFLRPAYREYFNRAAQLPQILTSTLINMIRHPGQSGISQLIGELGKAVPSGFFDNETVHDFLQQTYELTGHSNQFDDLECQLYIVAVDLDSGTAVRFGSEGHRDVSISRAVQASAALPGLYPPVEINGRFYVDGALRRTLHASAALDENIDMLIGINPLVPFDTSQKSKSTGAPSHKLTHGGLPLILSQAFRALIQSRMEAGFKKYYRSHPFADLVLLEPDRGDEKIFFTNIFSYSDRNALCEHAYQSTRKDLLAQHTELDPVLEKLGLSLNIDMLKDQQRSLEDSISEGQTSHAALARGLTSVLNDLDELLDDCQPG